MAIEEGPVLAAGDERSERALLQVAREAAVAEAEGPHPSSEDVIAYAGGELSPVAAERMRDHLAACAECRDLMALWHELPPAGPIQEPAEPAPRPTGVATGGWATEAGARFRPGVFSTALLAAAALVLAAGLGWWVGGGGDGETELAAAANPRLVELDPVGEVRRGGGTREVEAAAGAAGYVFILPAPEGPEDRYRMELADGSLGRVIRLELAADRAGRLTFRLPGDLAPGRYTVTLTGMDGRPRGETAFRLEPATGR